MGELTEINVALAELINVECYPIAQEELHLSKFSKIPMADIASIGAGMSSIPQALRTTTTTFSTPVANLYQEMSGINLTGVSDGNGLLRGFSMNAGGKGISAQGAFKPVEGLNTSVATVTPFNPATMCMAIALMSIDHKMNQIIEIDEKILQRIVIDDKARLRNDLKTLKDIAEDYRFNWNNERFLDAQYKMAADIKRDAGKDIIKYRELIENKLQKKSLIQGDLSINKLISEAAADFEEYQLATYVFAYASFITVMLQGNFDSAYLSNVVSKLENNSLQYQELYTKAYNTLMQMADNTLESHVLEVVSQLGKVFGKAASYVPGFEQLSVDDALLDGSEKLDAIGDEKVKNQLKRLVSLRYSYSRPFIENVEQVKRIYNEPTHVLFDDENVYLQLDA